MYLEEEAASMVELMTLKTFVASRKLALPSLCQGPGFQTSTVFTKASLSHRVLPLHCFLGTTGQPRSPLIIAMAILVSGTFINRKTNECPPKRTLP